MKQAAKLAFAFAGVALGTGAAQGLHAQAAKPAPAYLVAEIQVTDQAGYQAYLKKAVESLKPYHARIISRGKPEVVEGAAAQGNALIVEFPTMADAMKWYSTPPYKDLIAERQKSAKSRLYFLDGVP